MQTVKSTPASQQVYTEPVVEYNGYPIVGILPELIKNKPYDTFNHIVDNYGDFVKIKVGPKSLYLVSNPDYLQQILRDNHKNYVKPDLFYKGVRSAIGNGLVNSDGDFWLRQRRMMQPFFHRKFLGELFNNMIDGINEILDQWDAYATSGEAINLNHALSQITLNVITKTMFGGNIPAEDLDEVSAHMKDIVDHVAIRGYLSFLPDWMPLPGKAKFEVSIERQRQVISGIIRSFRENPTEEYNLINMLIQSVDTETNEQMTDQQLFDEAITIFAAGFETTATMLSWLFCLLNDLPHIHRNIMQEIDTVLGKNQPQIENVRQLEYCKRTMQETMRMRTVAPMLPRQSLEDDMLGDHVIPGGSIMLMWFSGLHRNKAIWENPDVFDPQRFTPENSEDRSQFAYLPFGGGPRVCIGNEFAYMEGVLAMSMILQRYRINFLPDQDIQPEVSAVLRPSKPVMVTLERV